MQPRCCAKTDETRMRNLLKFLIVFALVLGFSAAAQAQQGQAAGDGQAASPSQSVPPSAEDPMVGADAPIDLGAAVDRGLRFNPQIEAARFELTGKGYARYSAMGAMGPSATAGWAYSRADRKPTQSGRVIGARDDWTFTLNVTQPVFRGFGLLSKYQRAKLQEEQATAKLTDAELQLIQTIQTTFLELLKGRMDVKSAEDSVARLRSQLEVTQAFYDVGLKPKLDVLQAEVDLATAEQTLLSAKNDVDTQTARLNTLLGLPLDYGTNYTGELNYLPFQRTLDDCLSRAYKNRPDLEIGRKSVEIAQKDAKIAAADFYPSVDATYDYSQSGNSPEMRGSPYDRTGYTDWSVGAKASWTFFESGKTFNAYREARENVAKIEAELANTRLDASFQVKQGLLNLQEAKDRIGVARKSVTAAQEGYRMAVARYQAQVGTNTDVLDAQSRLSEAETQLSTALADYQKALSGLYVAMGEKNTALSQQ